MGRFLFNSSTKSTFKEWRLLPTGLEKKVRPRKYQRGKSLQRSDLHSFKSKDIRRVH